MTYTIPDWTDVEYERVKQAVRSMNDTPGRRELERQMFCYDALRDYPAQRSRITPSKHTVNDANHLFAGHRSIALCGRVAAVPGDTMTLTHRSVCNVCESVLRAERGGSDKRAYQMRESDGDPLCQHEHSTERAAKRCAGRAGIMHVRIEGEWVPIV